MEKGWSGYEALKADAGAAGWFGRAVEVRLIYLLRYAYFALFLQGRLASRWSRCGDPQQWLYSPKRSFVDRLKHSTAILVIQDRFGTTRELHQATCLLSHNLCP